MAITYIHAAYTNGISINGEIVEKIEVQKKYLLKSCIASITQGCHNRHFWMKITVRTSARVRVYPADGFLPSANVVKTASAPTQVPAGAGPRGPVTALPLGQGGAEFRVFPIKEGALPLFPHFQPNPVE
jgi:hypothetical protein